MNPSSPFPSAETLKRASNLPILQFVQRDEQVDLPLWESYHAGSQKEAKFTQDSSIKWTLMKGILTEEAKGTKTNQGWKGHNTDGHQWEAIVAPRGLSGFPGCENFSAKWGQSWEKQDEVVALYRAGEEETSDWMTEMQPLSPLPPSFLHLLMVSPLGQPSLAAREQVNSLQGSARLVNGLWKAGGKRNMARMEVRCVTAWMVPPHSGCSPHARCNHSIAR